MASSCGCKWHGRNWWQSTYMWNIYIGTSSIGWFRENSNLKFILSLHSFLLVSRYCIIYVVSRIWIWINFRSVWLWELRNTWKIERERVGGVWGGARRGRRAWRHIIDQSFDSIRSNDNIASTMVAARPPPPPTAFQQHPSHDKHTPAIAIDTRHGSSSRIRSSSQTTRSYLQLLVSTLLAADIVNCHSGMMTAKSTTIEKGGKLFSRERERR